MRLFMAALIAAFSFVAVTTQAQARRHHRHHYHYTDKTPVYAGFISNMDNNGHYLPFVEPQRQSPVRYSGPAHIRVASGGENVIGGRPAGCPHAFCGCEASRYLFGRIVPELNLAYNWIRKFPRTSPAPGMAAARNHHVMVLISHAGGSDWYVHDGNSGHGLTREHVRSISGYTVVDPHGARYASR
jgi:hypothetical protein